MALATHVRHAGGTLPQNQVVAERRARARSRKRLSAWLCHRRKPALRAVSSHNTHADVHNRMAIAARLMASKPLHRR